MAHPVQTATELAPEACCYEVDGFRVDERTLEVRDPRGKIVGLSAIPFELLLHLIRHRDRVVTKAELFHALWPKVTVNENAVAQCVWAVRKALGDGGRAPRLIKNVRGRGYRLVAKVDAAARRRAPAANADFAETEPLGALRTTLEEALDARGSVCLLSHDAGSRSALLMQELLAEARTAGFVTLNGRCYDDEGMPAFWPWKEVLRTYARRSDTVVLRALVGADASDLARVIPELSRNLREQEPAPQRRPDDEQYCVLRAATDFLLRASRNEPICALVEDLHWADAPTLLLFKFLAPAVERSRCVIIGTYQRACLDPLRSTTLSSIARVQNASL